MELPQLEIKTTCRMCPHECRLSQGQVGKCLIRKGHYNLPYSTCFTDYEDDSTGIPVAVMAIEPLSKKPIYHFLDKDTKTLSLGGYGCSMSCGYCVTGDTLISTPSGLKRMDQIQDGEEIVACDNSTSDPQLVLAHVGHVFDREVEEVIELEVDGRTIVLTEEHPVLTQRGWVEAGCLTEDDEVLCDKTYLEQFHSTFQNDIQDKEKKE